MKRLQIELRKLLFAVAQGSRILEIIDTLFDPLEKVRKHPVRKFCVVTSPAWKNRVNGSLPL